MGWVWKASISSVDIASLAVRERERASKRPDPTLCGNMTRRIFLVIFVVSSLTHIHGSKSLILLGVTARKSTRESHKSLQRSLFPLVLSLPLHCTCAPIHFKHTAAAVLKEGHISPRYVMICSGSSKETYLSDMHEEAAVNNSFFFWLFLAIDKLEINAFKNYLLSTESPFQSHVRFLLFGVLVRY